MPTISLKWRSLAWVARGQELGESGGQEDRSLFILLLHLGACWVYLLSSYLYCFSFRFSLITWSPSILFSKHLTVLLFTGDKFKRLGPKQAVVGYVAKGKTWPIKDRCSLLLKMHVSNTTASHTLRSLCRLYVWTQKPQTPKTNLCQYLLLMRKGKRGVRPFYAFLSQMKAILEVDQKTQTFQKPVVKEQSFGNLLLDPAASHLHAEGAQFVITITSNIVSLSPSQVQIWHSVGKK